MTTRWFAGADGWIPPAEGVPGFWRVAIGGIWLAAGLVGLYLNAVSRAKVGGKADARQVRGLTVRG